ncbi:MAG: rhodanese-like domain-containing protein [Coriobacteriia bacterium]|nr:rhodanese-like domain-containing protein [Coriobacteriia bacterium]MCL2749827.1 rhodanese-like domain-containing protein [Coriobacteriia bacterium]
MKKLILAVILVATLLLSVCLGACAGTANSSNPQTISANEAHQMIEGLDDFILLDVRSVEEFQEGHVGGALLIPVSELEVRAAEELPNKDTTIFIYCRSGNRSATAAQILADMGYTKVYDIGGMPNWGSI